MRLLRRLAFLVVELAAVALVLTAVALYAVSEYVDTEGFRNRFVSVVETLTGQPVVLRGELNIALYPTLSLEVRDLALMERPEAGDAPLAHYDRFYVSARLLPLLAHRLEFRSIVVRGMHLDLARLADGGYNWRPMPASEPSSGIGGGYIQSVSLDGLEVDNATITYTDAISGQKLRLAGVTLHTGSIVPGNPVPFSAQSLFSWKNGGLESRLTLKGRMVVDASGNILLKDASAYATLGGPFLPQGAAPAEVAANVGVDWDNRTISLDKFHVQFLGLAGEGSLRTGDLGQGVSGTGHLTLRPFKPVDMVRRYFPGVPVDRVDGLKSGAFASFVDFDETGVHLRDMAVVLDDMTVRGDMAVKDFSRPVCTFDLRGDVVDLDRYLPLFRTDTPFVWGDFRLDAFRAFRGEGTVRADALRVLGISLSDARLAVKADGRTIRTDASAESEGLGTLNGTAGFQLGRDKDTTTFGLGADLTAASGRSGFAFLRGKAWEIGGAGKLSLSLRVPPGPCPVQTRSIGILRRTRLNATLDLGKGVARYTPNGGPARHQSYNAAVLALKAAPAPATRAGFFGFTVEGSVRGKGGVPFDAFSLSAAGPVQLDVDNGRADGRALDVRAALNGRAYTDAPDQATASGRVSFDSAGRTLEWNDAALHLLGTAVKGEVRVDGSGKSVKAAGKIDIPSADARDIVRRLTGTQPDLRDPVALRRVGVSADFAASGAGFTLSGLRGDLDGMSFTGLVVGQGWDDPALTVSLTAGKLDLDRYLPRTPEPTLAEQRAGKRTKKAPPAKLPLDFLRRLRVNGKAAFTEFKLARIRTQDLSGVLKAEKGSLRISTLKGRTYDGVLKGDLAVEVGQRDMTTSVALHVKGMQAGPLMQDLAEREYVRGATDLDIDLSSVGATDDDILADLQGECRVVITDGAFKFSGFEQPAKAAAGATTARTLSSDNLTSIRQQQRHTPFSRATATFTVRKGVFTVHPFQLDSSLLKSTGTGWFSLPGNEIKLSVRNDFVAVPSVTIDVVGRLSDPEVRVPKGKILDNTVRNILSLPQKSFRFLRDLFM